MESGAVTASRMRGMDQQALTKRGHLRRLWQVHHSRHQDSAPMPASERRYCGADGKRLSIALKHQGMSIAGLAVQRSVYAAPGRMCQVQLVDAKQLVARLNTIDCSTAALRRDRRDEVRTTVGSHSNADLSEIVNIRIVLLHPVREVIRVVDRQSVAFETVAADPADHGNRVLLRVPRS